MSQLPFADDTTLVVISEKLSSLGRRLEGLRGKSKRLCGKVKY